MGKRSRACEQCHRLKIKCDLSTTSGGVCDRCSRNNLDCVPAAPRLQRDRIDELEAQVQELRKALREQSDRRIPGCAPGSLVEDPDHALLSYLDSCIPLHKQQDLLHMFTAQAGAAWPVIRLPTELARIRAKSPVLLLSVLVYCVTHESQGTALDVHDELVRETMHILGSEVIGRGRRSLELVQALLVATFWNKPTRGSQQQGSCFQILQLAADMAIDLGIAGPLLQPSPVAYFCRHEDPGSLEARRTWLACFIALSTASITMRRPSPVPWDAHQHEYLVHLESSGDTSDMLLCQIVRITRLIQEISQQLRLCHIDVFVDGNAYSTHTTIESLKNTVDAWAAQIPPSLASCPALTAWRHIAMIYIYEPVLHTPTNKASFAAPFIPGRIPVNDFPAPPHMIPPLPGALNALIYHCHAVVDTVTEMDPALVLALPTFSFAPTVLYAVFVLVTTLVATSDPVNTYGQSLPNKGDVFHIAGCGEKLRSLTARLKGLDPSLSCYSTRMFDATGWLEEWCGEYRAILSRYEMSVSL